MLMQMESTFQEKLKDGRKIELVGGIRTQTVLIRETNGR